MRTKNKWRIWGIPCLWQITAIMVACSLVYYLPTIAGLMGWADVQPSLNRLHDFYGLDFYALIFFVPVVYVAYVMGVIGAVVIALVSMCILIPYSMVVAQHADALFRPTAFAIILSAVGAVVAMLQKSDEQRRRSMNELKCLYDIGKAAESNNSIDGFLSSVVEIISRAMCRHGNPKVRVVVREKVYCNLGLDEAAGKIEEKLVVGDEVLGTLEIHANRNCSYLKNETHLMRTLAERISGAVHGIELEQSVKAYYEQLEEMVEKRTRDLEQAQEKLIRSERLAAVGELASGVGHELRNPLNVIRNCVYLLSMGLDGKEDDETLSTLKLLDQQVDISNRIVSDLLDFTRVRLPSLARVDLNRLVKDSLSWVAVPQNITVIQDLDGKVPQVRVDAEQVARAFTNIISNAVQSITGTGELRISTSVDGNRAWVKFTDTGCGIPEENMKKLFEPLFTTKPKGIGLGLAITKRLVEQNGGAIEVTSLVGKGTTFTLKLPVTNKEVDEHERASQYTCRG